MRRTEELVFETADGEEIRIEVPPDIDNDEGIVLESKSPAVEPPAQVVDNLLTQAQAEILVLTRDDAFVHAVRKAVEDTHAINHASDLKQAIAIMADRKSGVLLTDAAVAHSQVHSLVVKLKQYLPTLVTIVAGRRDDGDSLMKLISSGEIYRFLLKPISPGQTRLCIDAAVKRHGEYQADPDTLDDLGGGGLRKFGFATVGLVVAVLAVGGVWYTTQRDNSPEPTVATAAEQPPTIEAVEPQVVASTTPDQTVSEPGEADIEQALARARLALQQGHFVTPQGDNARDYYLLALAMSPDHQEAYEGLDGLADIMFSEAEAALLSEQIDAATRALDAARSIRPEHPRLSFIETQISKERERLLLVRVREASAAGRFDQSRQLLAEAADVRHGVGSEEIEQARRELRQRETDADNNLQLTLAKQRAERDLEEAREAARRAEEAALAAKAADSRPAPPTRREVEPEADRPPPDAPAMKAMVATSSAQIEKPSPFRVDDRSTTEPSVALDNEEIDPYLVSAINTEPPPESRGMAESREEPPADEKAGLLDTSGPVAVSALDFRKYVNPRYPRRACNDGVDGWVDVEFTVNHEGETEEIQVLDASVPGQFENAAVNAVKRWRFEPVVVDGAVVRQRATVRVRFKVEQ